MKIIFLKSSIKKLTFFIYPIFSHVREEQSSDRELTGVSVANPVNGCDEGVALATTEESRDS